MKKLLNGTLLLILTLIWAAPALAQEGRERPGQVIFGHDLRLEAGDIVKGDVVIFGGNLHSADGSRIEGDVVVFGGTGEINGQIEGDLVLFGGSARLGPTARVDGDVATVGGQADRDEDAYVSGDIIETTRFDFGQIPFPFVRAVPPRPEFDQGMRFEPFNLFFRLMTGLVQSLVLALVIAAIGLLAVLFLPEHTQTVGQTIRQAAPASFGVGLLTLMAGIAVMILFFVTCCLIPIGLLVGLALVLAALYGWIVVGYLLGARMLRAIRQDRAEPTPTAAALVGIFVVTLVQQGLMALSNIPCLGFFFWLLSAGIWLLIASIGLGAVVLTRFGTQPYTGTPPVRRPPPPLPPLPPTPPAGPAQLEPGGASEPSPEDETGAAADTQPKPAEEAAPGPPGEAGEPNTGDAP